MADEFERRFLVNHVPSDFIDPTEELVIDHYLPLASEHAQLRVRRKGSTFEITKKLPAMNGELSHMIETTIPLNEPEYQALMLAPGKTLSKLRIRTLLQGAVAEFGEFQGELAGLIILDVEFTDKAHMARFDPPEYVVAEITNDKRFAGGELCGKNFADIKVALSEYGYASG